MFEQINNQSINQIVLPVGASPWTPLGELTALPQPP